MRKNEQWLKGHRRTSDEQNNFIREIRELTAVIEADAALLAEYRRANDELRAALVSIASRLDDDHEFDANELPVIDTARAALRWTPL